MLPARISFAILLTSLAARAAGPDAAALYQKHCAACHDPEKAAAARAPERRALAVLPVDRIVASMETGSMKAEAAALSGAERRALAELLGAKVIPSESAASTGACPAGGAPPDFASGPRWIGWSPDPANSRFQPASMAGLVAQDVPRLKLKWAFGYHHSNIAFGAPTVAGGRLFAGSQNGEVYSLNAATGCTYWSYKAATAVRSAVALGPVHIGSRSRYVVYFGDVAANVYGLDATTGELLWKVQVEDHPAARVTGSPQLHDGRLYVPVSSIEEISPGNPGYSCCKFRGSLVALDAATGKQLWKTYTIPDPPQPTKKNAAGTQLFGPAGAAIWSTPTLDLKRKVIYVSTGNAYSDPAPPTSDAILAIDMESGSMLWSKQLTPGGDPWNFACMAPNKSSCPAEPGKDFDFGSSPILRSLPGGKSVLVCGQKSGVVHALDPDRRGEIVWQVRVGKGSALGGIQWGPAADDSVAYVALSDKIGTPPEAAGGLFALRLATGERVWQTPAPKPPCLGKPGCSAAQSAAVTLIPGVVFSGSLDGHLRAFATADGSIVWDFDTLRDFDTVNGVKANGGSLNGPGAVIAGGMLYVNSGYRIFGEMGGNVLLAFSVDGK